MITSSKLNHAGEAEVDVPVALIQDASISLYQAIPAAEDVGAREGNKQKPAVKFSAKKTKVTRAASDDGLDPSWMPTVRRSGRKRKTILPNPIVDTSESDPDAEIEPSPKRRRSARKKHA